MTKQSIKIEDSEDARTTGLSLNRMVREKALELLPQVKSDEADKIAKGYTWEKTFKGHRLTKPRTARA